MICGRCNLSFLLFLHLAILCSTRPLAFMEGDNEKIGEDTLKDGPTTDDEKDKEALQEESADLFEGDMMVEPHVLKTIEQGETAKRDTVSGLSKLWDYGKVPYIFDNSFEKVNMKMLVKKAAEILKNMTCISFYPRVREEHYVTFKFGTNGCFSSLGRMVKLSQQVIELTDNCAYVGTVLHEMMHTIGFFHEQSRMDRDHYVTINWNNIQKHRETQFRKYPHGDADFVAESYDYESIMHYPRNAFSANGLPTILPINGPWREIGRRDKMSEIDIRKVNKLYSCDKVKKVKEEEQENENKKIPNESGNKNKEGKNKGDKPENKPVNENPKGKKQEEKDKENDDTKQNTQDNNDKTPQKTNGDGNEPGAAEENTDKQGGNKEQDDEPLKETNKEKTPKQKEGNGTSADIQDAITETEQPAGTAQQGSQNGGNGGQNPSVASTMSGNDYNQKGVAGKNLRQSNLEVQNTSQAAIGQTPVNLAVQGNHNYDPVNTSRTQPSEKEKYQTLALNENLKGTQMGAGVVGNVNQGGNQNLTGNLHPANVERAPAFHTKKDTTINQSTTGSNALPLQEDLNNDASLGSNALNHKQGNDKNPNTLDSGNASSNNTVVKNKYFGQSDQNFGPHQNTSINAMIKGENNAKHTKTGKTALESNNDKSIKTMASNSSINNQGSSPAIPPPSAKSIDAPNQNSHQSQNPNAMSEFHNTQKNNSSHKPFYLSNLSNKQNGEIRPGNISSTNQSKVLGSKGNAQSNEKNWNRQTDIANASNLKGTMPIKSDVEVVRDDCNPSTTLCYSDNYGERTGAGTPSVIWTLGAPSEKEDVERVNHHATQDLVVDVNKDQVKKNMLKSTDQGKLELGTIPLDETSQKMRRMSAEDQKVKGNSQKGLESSNSHPMNDIGSSRLSSYHNKSHVSGVNDSPQIYVDQSPTRSIQGPEVNETESVSNMNGSNTPSKDKSKDANYMEVL